MQLESQTCEMCIWQKRETVKHLFFCCRFAKACWNSIGITYTSTRTIQNIILQIKNKLQVPFYMEIIILIAWSIWTTRNGWFFNNLAPSPGVCLQKFTSEFKDILLRVKPRYLQQMEIWLHLFAVH
uniref:Reverse transcriptase zinc-binding domain-containing protein n=1 Tax=Setaria viridis TaxID=4556 RepID=A0A4V6D377_SETVI|nr:hypothetical protein SEVIR_8G176700v2 [Setaria viridis]